MLPDSLSIAVAVGLVFLNGFFTAAELSMARVRNTRIEELVQAGDWRARAVRGHQERLQYFLSATQLGITLASLGLGWMGEPAFAHVLAPVLGAAGVTSEPIIHNVSAAVAFLFITFLHILIGELVPKAYAIRATERVVEAHASHFGRPLPVNVDGAIAAISADLGFAYELGNAIFLISRLPGLIAHAHEERTRQSPMRQIDPKDHNYDGAGQRRLPEGRK